jgi:hypothetical protein
MITVDLGGEVVRVVRDGPVVEVRPDGTGVRVIAPGPPGPTAVSSDPGNTATLGTDHLIYVPASDGGGGGGGLTVEEADARYLSLGGGSLGGDLMMDVPAGDHGIFINSPQGSPIIMFSRAGLPYWAFYLSEGDDSVGIGRFDGAGDLVGSPFYVNHVTGEAAFERPLTLVDPVPVMDDHAASKGYVDSRIWSGTQAEYDALGAHDPVVLYVVVP